MALCVAGNQDCLQLHSIRKGIVTFDMELRQGDGVGYSAFGNSACGVYRELLAMVIGGSIQS